MLLDDKACYTALRARDARFDGRFFVGVASTGIYCRPICPAKLSKEENCSFFISAAAAEAAGYRPCLRCRPELAPGSAPVDAAMRLAQSAALITPRLSDVANRLGITDRHLRRVFLAEYGVSPVQYLQTQRLLLAKNLLTDTGLSVTDVAMYAGFGSIRRFNDLFKKYYRLAPSRFRHVDGKAPNNSDEITLSLGYRPPYIWETLISFLAGRAIPGVESVAWNVYRRTVAIKQGATVHRGWISVANRPQKGSLSVTVAASLLPVLAQVLARVRHLFDTDSNPMEIADKLAVMNEFSPGLFVPGIRLPGCFDPFEMAVRAVLGQQVTVKAARTLSGRLAAGLGEAVATPFAELTVTFPWPERICALGRPIEDHLGPLGITGARSRSILSLAEALTTRSIALAHYVDAEQEIEKLLRLPGFGPWTVQYIAMRALGWPDAFPHTDYGVKKALADRKPQEILEIAQSWCPWRSYATIALWNSLAKTFIHHKELVQQ